MINIPSFMKFFLLLLHFFRIMDWRKAYDLEYKGLNEGQHEFNFEVHETFFEHFEQGLVDVGNVVVKVILEKRSAFLKLYFNLSGWVELTCDRCLDNYRQVINHKSTFFVKFGENEYEDDEIIWVLPDEHRINLAQLIYEYIILSIPIRHVHPEEKMCNAKMLDTLKKHERRSDATENKNDPRWAQLKNWKNN